MTVDHLLRNLAPIGAEAWKALDDEARERLKPGLAARRLVDLEGPRGWEYSAVALGRSRTLTGDDWGGIEVAQREVRPLIEVRCPFDVDVGELLDIERGARDPNLDGLAQAARLAAVTENRIIFHGHIQAGIGGIADSSPQTPVQLSSEVTRYPSNVALALEALRDAGIDGPYGLALAPEVYRAVVENTEDGGYPLFRHLHEMVEGPMVRAPGLRGGLLLSLDSSHWSLRLGQDLSIGYNGHERQTVHLYIEETLAFQVVTAEAAVWLRP